MRAAWPGCIANVRGRWRSRDDRLRVANGPARCSWLCRSPVTSCSPIRPHASWKLLRLVVSAAAGEALDRFGLAHLAERHPLSLSGGERQRLAIAAGVLQGARVLVLDEPTSGLDFGNMQAVARELSRVRDDGTCVAVITHDYEFIVAACDEVAVMAGGRVSVQEPLARANLPAVRRTLGFDG